MPSTYRTPGVYIEEISKFPPSVAQVETAIPAFIGYTQKAIVRGIDLYADAGADADADADAGDAGGDDKVVPTVIRITSLLEYVQIFGEAEKETGIQVTVAKSGEVSVVVEKPSENNMYYALQGFFANGGGPCYIASVGKTGSGSIEQAALDAGLSAIAKEDEVTLIVFPESLSLGVSADFQTLHNNALTQCKDLQDRFLVMDAVLDADNQTVVQAAQSFRSDLIGVNNLKYGAAYGPRLETIFDYAYDDADVTVTINYPDKADGTPPDTPTSETTLAALDPKTAQKDGQYYPLVKSAIGAEPVVLPAAPLVVGVYAAVDSDRGVWKAPANVSLNAVVGPTVRISSAEQDGLNIDTSGKSINAIRSFTGKGTLIWGARTLAGNDNEWRYVPVRRFFNMAEESIKKATEAFVFEPNDANTWVKVKAMIENFLTLQWRAGALAGAKPDQAFYVKVGLNETMTALDILEGRMIIEIGMAVVRPAEFIILKFSHKMQES
ncbi:MAG: phage tail sheath family protein [Phormidesmis sp.]